MASKHQESDASEDRATSKDISKPSSARGNRWNWLNVRCFGTLGVGSGTFSGLEIGCVGAVMLVLLTAGVMFGLVALVWWTALKK
jgi:hypothetical protein